MGQQVISGSLNISAEVLSSEKWGFSGMGYVREGYV